MKLNDLKLEEEAIITKVDAHPDIKRRLLDIGLVRGAKIKKVLASKKESMIAYEIKGTVIAIRKDDTKDIEVTK